MNKKDLKLEWCSYEAAKFAVMRWHYSKAMPASKLAKIGVWEDGKFIGAVIYGMGANNNLSKMFGLRSIEVCELVRVALNKHRAPVTKIVSISLTMIKKRYPGLQVVVSYADPFQGHMGGIYQAGNWFYLGETPPDKFPILDGRVAHPRTLSERVKAGKTTRSAVEYVKRPGKHRYAYPLNSIWRGRLEEMAAKVRTRPK
jgi:hypothetical protein